MGQEAGREDKSRPTGSIEHDEAYLEERGRAWQALCFVRRFKVLLALVLHYVRNGLIMMYDC